MHILFWILVSASAAGCGAVTGPDPLPIERSDPGPIQEDDTARPDSTIDFPSVTALTARISGGESMGAAGRRERVTIACASPADAGLASVSWMMADETTDVDPPPDGGPWTSFEVDVQVTVTEPTTVFVLCRENGGKLKSARRMFSAPPPPGVDVRNLPNVSIGTPFAVALNPDPVIPTVHSVISSQNVRDIVLRNDSLFATGGTMKGALYIRLRRETPFGEGIVHYAGDVQPLGKLTIWTNTSSRVDFLDASGRSIRQFEWDAGVHSMRPESGLARARSVRITAVDGNHFSVRRPFSYPETGSTVILNAYQVSMQPCRDHAFAWGSSFEECRNLMVDTMFPGGYGRYDRPPEAIFVGLHPMTGDRLPGDWHAVMENVRLDWESRGVYMNRLPGLTEPSEVRFQRRDGRLYPAERGRIMVVPDARAVEPEVRYAINDDGYHTGAMLVVPTSLDPGPFMLDLPELTLRAWHPFAASARLDALPPVRRRHFLATVVAALRAEEGGISGLYPGDRAGDVLIIP